MPQHHVFQQIDKYLRNIDDLVKQFEGFRYSFTDNVVFKGILETNQTDAMRIYWREILIRAHLAASTSILRSRRWVDGILAAVESKNLLVLGASMRGLFESAADSSVALVGVPESLARDYDAIENALIGSLGGKIILNPGLEETLIHYSHATKVSKGTYVPECHRAKTVNEYLDILNRGGVPHIKELYSFLCDLTHPGASSVGYWLEQEGETQLILHTAPDFLHIGNILAEYRETFLSVLMFSFNPGLATLAVLNYFSLPSIHTPDLQKWNLNNIPLWSKLGKYLSGIPVKVKDR
jgi:hypothetical protein